MLSVSSKHALRALKYLANLDRDAYYSIDTISRAVDVPAAYLAKLMKILARKKIVISKKGVGGGISLPIKRKLSFYDVCKALNRSSSNLAFFHKNRVRLKDIVPFTKNGER